MNKIILLVLITFSFFSCKKDPGFGGLAKIKGKVYAYDYTSGGTLEAEGYTPDIKVYIGVNGIDGVLKKVDTDLNGSFEFSGLRKGTYNIWVYTECDNCTGNIKPVLQTINIEGNKQEVTMPDFKINI